MNWIFDDKPKEAGWYAVSYCWEIEEGVFPGAAYWDGTKWNRKFPITAYYGPFQDDDSAEEWAYDHDLEGNF